ncbi:hypothetical protein F4561_002675 [Lipingzhangella halophila]|uniref:Uncharacterized protein n=1 Tax=Lipingzhangella halophila TaxID=1783352 RepID=A0A7W7RH29_9ACTN|nr:hypothetical protein [Lipingzhangella halophila]MBB4931855.1 hypothetical protein [Lipingzhangella halophila]
MADFSEKERDRLASEGKAMAGGRYPIRNRGDLQNAISAVGRAKGGEEGRRKVRRHIAKRARALGLSSMIPDTWGSGGSLKDN